MKFKINDRAYVIAHPEIKGTIVRINSHPTYNNLQPWLMFAPDNGKTDYFRENQLAKIQSMKSNQSSPTVKFLDKWKRVFNVYSLEIHSGVQRNTIAHSVSRERRPLNPFEEDKILEILKQMKRDIEKLKLP